MMKGETATVEIKKLRVLRNVRDPVGGLLARRRPILQGFFPRTQNTTIKHEETFFRNIKYWPPKRRPERDSPVPLGGQFFRLSTSNAKLASKSGGHENASHRTQRWMYRRGQTSVPPSVQRMLIRSIIGGDAKHN
jgi:hypothetical protein